MYKIEEKDVTLSLEKVECDFNEIVKDFEDKNRKEILDEILKVVRANAHISDPAESLVVLIEFVYYLWNTYCSNCKFSEEVLGEKVDYTAINGDIIEVACINIIEKIESEKIDISVIQEDRMDLLFKENEDFVVYIMDYTKELFQYSILAGAILAFYSIEETMRRISYDKA